mmetsp:Transcript_99673/g.277591  ORF Transcript_99673/g.277591 Transcript_99673/m.277591 type:complete len:296 (+) Transcript_99673:100-987(+)
MGNVSLLTALFVAGIAWLPFALLAYDPYIVERLRPCAPKFVFQLRLRLEAGDPSVPATRSALWARDRRGCARALQARARHNCGGRCSLVFVGDSILESLAGGSCYDPKLQSPAARQAFEAALPKRWQAAILAGGGDQTQHTLRHLDLCLPALHTPRAFFVLLGSNNLVLQGSMTPAQTLRGLRAVVDALQRGHPGAVVMLHAILPRSNDQAHFQKDPSKFFQRKIDRTNQLIRDFAEGNKSVVYIDCGGVFPRGTGQATRALMPDFIHPNPEGYRRWFRCLVPIFGRVLNETVPG